MKSIYKRVLGGGVILSILLSIWTVATAEHHPSLAWMARYFSASGVGCCSERDCLPTPVAVVQFGEQNTTVLIRGTLVVLPTQSVHQSETAETYWCSHTAQLAPSRTNTRCVFWTAGS